MTNTSFNLENGIFLPFSPQAEGVGVPGQFTTWSTDNKIGPAGVPSGSLLDQLTGFSSTGVLERTGPGAYSFLSVGTAAHNLLQLDGSGRIPAVDGSQLLNLPDGGGSGAFINVATASPTILPDGTDQSSNLSTLLAALQASGKGATLQFPPGTYRFNSAIVLPNDGTTGAAPHQVSIKFEGAGAQYSGQTGAYPGSATVFDIRTSDTHGHIQSYGLGLLTIEGITITDGGTSSGNPFVYVTNTTLHFRHNTVLGQSGFNGTANDQDAIVLGGTSTTIDGTSNAAFQGYGTIISENQFDRIRRLAYVRVFANGVVIEKNWVERNSGNPLTHGSVIEIDGTGAGGASGQIAVGTNISNNVVEICNYSYFVNNLVGEYTTVIGNSLFDPTATTLGGVLNSAASVDTFVVGNLLTGKPFVAGTTATITFIGQALDGVPSTFPAGVGPLTVNGTLVATGLTSTFGVAGSSNVLMLPQTSGSATFNADSSNVVFRNTGTGIMFFDSLSSGGGIVFRSGASITNVLDYNNSVSASWSFQKPAKFASGTTSSSTTTGAAIVSGGLGVSGAAFIGGNVTAASMLVSTNQVVGARVTGWNAPTTGGGAISRGTFDTGATLLTTAETLAALITDLRAHGLIGT